MPKPSSIADAVTTTSSKYWSGSTSTTAPNAPPSSPSIARGTETEPTETPKRRRSRSRPVSTSIHQAATAAWGS